MSPADLPEALVAAIAELDKERAAALALVDVARDAEEVSRMFGFTPCCRVIGEGITTYIDVQSMAQAVPVIRELRRRGYKISHHVDSPPTSRCYHMGKLHLYVSLPVSEGAACRFEQVGTREVPVYELRCNDEVAS